MIIINEGRLPEDNDEIIVSGACTEEPGDNCWLQLD